MLTRTSCTIVLLQAELVLASRAVQAAKAADANPLVPSPVRAAPLHAALVVTLAGPEQPLPALPPRQDPHLGRVRQVSPSLSASAVAACHSATAVIVCASCCRAQGLLGLGRTPRRTCTTSSLSPLTATSEVDADDSVFDSPLFSVQHCSPQQPLQDLQESPLQRDWLLLPLQDLESGAYVNPAFVQPQQDPSLASCRPQAPQNLLPVLQDSVNLPLRDSGDPMRPLQDFLKDSVSLGGYFGGPTPTPQGRPLAVPLQGAGLFRSERALLVVDGQDTITRTNRTSRRLERHLSEPHR